MKEDIQITLAEWLQELEEATGGSDEGLTTTELVELTGKPRKAILGLLHRAKKKGMLIVGRKQLYRLDGIATLAPCYKFKRAAEERT